MNELARRIRERRESLLAFLRGLREKEQRRRLLGRQKVKGRVGEPWKRFVRRLRQREKMPASHR